MQITNHEQIVPRNSKSAMNQAVHLHEILVSRRKKGENIMKKLQQLEDKLAKLTAEADKLKKNKEELLLDSQEYQKALNQLMTKFDLTEAEIIQHKLDRLKRSIQETDRLNSTGISYVDSDFS